MDRVRFGIVGCGSAALPVARAIANSGRASLGVVHDTRVELARDLGERYGVPYTAELDELLDDSRVDAVYIAVPHNLLSPLATRALETGKHVLVEKPMAMTVEAADALIELAASRRLALGVFYEMRHAPGYERAREIIRGNGLGEILAVRIQTLIDKPLSYWQEGYTGRSVSGWRGKRECAGGGVVLMNTSHQLDALWYVTGLEIKRVFAEMGTWVAKVEVEDSAVATFRFENGALGSLTAGAHLAGASTGNECFEIYGTRGTIRVPDPYSSDPLYVFLNEEWQGLASRIWHTITLPGVNVFQRAIDSFAAAVCQGTTPEVNGHAARRVLRIVLGLYRSAAENRAVDITAM